MFVLGAFLVGYYLGTKSEEGDLNEVVDSLRTIAASDEVRELAAGAFGMATDLVRSLAADGRAGEVVERVAGRGLRAV
ncbi:MAG: hypothetical protein QOC93_2055 [Actinomycetota bacterium]|nr:hypothetical protein [Cryptosporangiaceae bacterium]MDQ1676911.1 hypothetical protein [Actinomycetota bacterium]